MTNRDAMIGSFRSEFLRGFSERLEAAHQPGVTPADVAVLLSPVELSYLLAQGADNACSAYASIIGNATDSAIRSFLETSSKEADEILPFWKRMCDNLEQIASRTTWSRLTSTEADWGKRLAGMVMKSDGPIAATIVGRLLGAFFGIVVEQAGLIAPIKNLDLMYARFVDSVRNRFNRNVLPAFQRDVIAKLPSRPIS